MSKKVFISDPLLTELPFIELLDWTRFQTFCTDLLFSRNGITDSREYLGQGSAQGGIDCYATGPGQQMITAQCKLEKYLSPQDLQDLVDLFIQGEFAQRSAEFILCTNFDLGRHRDHEQNLQTVRDKLAQISIDFIVWDQNGLSTELRNRPAPHLVSRYFGKDIALAFYGEIYQAWFRSTRRLDKPAYTLDPNYIARRLVTYQDHREFAEQPARLFLDKRYLNLPDLIARPDRAGHCRYLILSTAGYGKTIELEHAAAWYAQEDQYLYPVKSYLADYEGQPVNELLDLHQPNWRDLEDDALLLIFDGLDEIREKYFQTFINHLNQFTQARAKTGVVVSTRFNFYDLITKPLRGFEILILQPFNQSDINEYIERNLLQHSGAFQAKIRQLRFQDLLDSPYYLARLVRYFQGKTEDFPATRSKLFERILFERFDADNLKKGDQVLRPVFFGLAKQISYAMTRLGAAALSSAQMRELLNGPEQLHLLQNFFLLNKHAAAPDAWSFEHKNLQEFLCAQVLESLPLADIRNLVTYSYNRKKVQPHFVNTLSFLFLTIDPKSELFKGLLQWLTTEQEELLVRFEKGRIPSAVRLEIFKKILRLYREQNKALYSSSGFSLEELMDFIQLDNQVISYLANEMMADRSGWYAWNGADILAFCRKPYLYADQLKALFLDILRSDFDDRVKNNALQALDRLEITDKNYFEKIFALPLNVDLPDIRHSLIHLLHGQAFMEDHMSFLIESLDVFEQQESHMNLLGSSEFLKMVLLQVSRPASVREVLLYALTDPDALSIEDRSDARINAAELKVLLEKGSALFPNDAELVEAVYQLYHRSPAITVYREWLEPILTFFKQNGGLSQQFYRSYAEDPKGRQIMPLAEEATCDFLIEEYRAGRISQDQMAIYRNVLSHVNTPLFNYFYQGLVREFPGEFDIPDIGFDYQKHWDSYNYKNQAMLLDQALYLEELTNIFAALGTTAVTKRDVHDYDNYKLREFRESIVLQMLRRESDKILRDEAYFAGIYSSPADWTSYKINEIYQLYERKKTSEERQLDPALLAFAVDWLHEQVAKLDFLNSVKDKETDRGFIFDRNVEFVCRLYLRLQPEMSDAELLKMLASDFRGGLDKPNQGISELVIEKVKDKGLLRKTVLDYIGLGLATYVQKTLFAICHQLNYTECQSLLYRFIRDNRYISGYDRCGLTDQYLALGGEIQDFSDMLVAPPYKVSENDISWEWYLLQKFMKAEPQAVTDLMLDVLADSGRAPVHQMTAAHNLISLGQIEGLRFWSDHIYAQKTSPFENIVDPIVPHILEMETGAVLDILLPMMGPFITTEAHIGRRRTKQLIGDYIADLLLMIVKAFPGTYARIHAEMERLITIETDDKALYWFKRYRDEITQAYQVVSYPEPTIADIRLELAQLPLHI